MSDAPRPLFVVNPAAQNGAAAKRWPAVAAASRALGLGDDVVFTQRAGHATELTRAALSQGRATIVAVGGDGTVNEVVNGFLDESGAPLRPSAELAIVAVGTGRDTVRTYRIPTGPEQAVMLLRSGATRQIDLGRATFRRADGSRGSRAFVNVGSCGLTGAVAERANRTSKRLGGTPSFLWATVATFAGWHNAPFAVEIDGERQQLVANNVICANGRYFGGAIKICPDAEPDDGLFDTLVWGDVGKLDLALNLPRLYRGTHLGHPKAQLVRARVVTVETETPMPIELDGELPGTTPVTFEIVRRALRLRVPPAESALR